MSFRLSSLLFHSSVRTVPTRQVGLCLGIGGVSLFAARQRPLLLDSSALASSPTSPASHSQSGKTPLLNNGKLNPKAVRQMSTGSIIGELRLDTAFRVLRLIP